MRRLIAALTAVAILWPTVLTPQQSIASDDRVLRIHHVNSGERQVILFKRNGKYVPEGLAAANRILRDWRTHQEIKIDPRLLDAVWEAYRRSGSRGYVEVIGGYRSPGTNAMLRSRSSSSGVAKDSLHTRGMAMDFFLTDVPLKNLRDIALQVQGGGVGYYPRSGSPFVHMDVGRVRHWPRLPPAEYAAIVGKRAPAPKAGDTLVAALDAEEEADRSFLSRLFSRRERPASVPEAPKVDAPVAAQAKRPAPSPTQRKVEPDPRLAPVAPSVPIEKAPAKVRPREDVLVAELRDVPIPTFALRPGPVAPAIPEPRPLPSYDALVADASARLPSSAAEAIGSATGKTADLPMVAAAFAPIDPIRPPSGVEDGLITAAMRQAQPPPMRMDVPALGSLVVRAVASIERPSPSGLVAPPTEVVIEPFRLGVAAAPSDGFAGKAVVFSRIARFGRG